MRSKSGLTLVEILISLTVITMALVPIINFYNYYLKENFKSNVKTQLKFLAQEEVEKVIAMDYRSKQLECFGSTAGLTNFYEKENFLIKTNVVFLDPETGELPESYPASDKDDTQLKRVTISVSKKNPGSEQVDMIYFKTP
jgi:hypothetical protein